MSDQTAEMVALAYIAGDEKFREFIEGVDHHLALVKPERIPDGVNAEDCVVRLSFPEYISLPPDKEKFIMTFASDGKIHATFTEDDLLRDADGNIVHPKNDSHWSIVEISRHECREVLNKKKDRGAGKVVNFCVVGRTPVLTQRGYVPIKDIRTDDLLWDGYNWVRHGGVVRRGEKLVIEYDGITGTPDHAVFTDQGKLTLIDARLRRAKIIEAAREDTPIRVSLPEVARGYDLRDRRRKIQAVCSNIVQAMRSGRRQKSGEHTARKKSYVSRMPRVSKVRWSSNGSNTAPRAAVQLHGAAMHEDVTQAVERLQRKRDQGGVLIERRVHNMGAQSVPGTDVQGSGVRPDRQYGKLLDNESPSCSIISKPCQQGDNTKVCCGRVRTFAPGRRLLARHHSESAATGFDTGRNRGATQKRTSEGETETEILQSAIQEHVYDIVDAGPFNRFTANGRLISNSSSYGGTAGSIARKIEQDTGVKMATEDVQGLLNAIEVRQPRATQWFKEQEELPKNSAVIKAASGRLRHLHTLSGMISGPSSRTRDGLLSALGRECRNFPIQERIGSTASQACVNIVDLCINHPELKGYPGVCLYDSIVIFCPENERFLWAKILQLYMRVRNGWAGPRGWILRLGVDTEFNSGWGTHPPQDKHDLYADESYEPLPDELKPLDALIDAQIAMFNNDPELSVYNTWDLP